jgi:2,4-dienoyl-CoA reductase-like NADH-dependent reductase (Old Yellow Enzyme family)/thioredoxin reductase
MADQFRNLFSPIKIGPFTVKNRIAFPAHGTLFRFLGDYEPPDQYVEYQRARAKGGCGLIVLTCSNLGMHPSSSAYLTNPDIAVPKYQLMADAVHQHGAIVVQQLMLRGAELGAIDLVPHPMWNFTERPCPTTQEVGHEMDEAQIEETLEAFVKYARACKQGGLDGVELHGTHGYMLQQSWSPWANQRHDRWGKQFAYAEELINRVRTAVGNEFIVGVRISADDWYWGDGAMTHERMKEVARFLEDTGKIDYISCSEGMCTRHYAISIANMYLPPTPFVALHAGIRQAVKRIPVIATGKIKDPIVAERILADGHADMVNVCRAQIADPEWANKGREGRSEDIRPCISCNQGCADRILGWHMPITCTQNPTVGREWEMGTEVGRASMRKKVLVVGGGPGGLEAARVAVLRGHDVTLVEKSNELGGLVNTLAKAPGRDEFGDVVRWRAGQLKKLGVKVKLGVDASVDFIADEDPDAVVVATGATAFVAPVPGASPDSITTPVDVLQGKASVGERVLVVDTTGLQEGATVAEYLADLGKKVYVVTPFPQVGMFMGFTNAPTVQQRLLSRGLVLIPSTQVIRMSDSTVYGTNVYHTAEFAIGDFDTVVSCAGYRADNSLYNALKGKVKKLYAVGDCVAPQRALQAVHDGYNTAKSL